MEDDNCKDPYQESRALVDQRVYAHLGVDIKLKKESFGNNFFIFSRFDNYKLLCKIIYPKKIKFKI